MALDWTCAAKGAIRSRASGVDLAPTRETRHRQTTQDMEKNGGGRATGGWMEDMGRGGCSGPRQRELEDHRGTPYTPGGVKRMKKKNY